MLIATFRSSELSINPASPAVCTFTSKRTLSRSTQTRSFLRVLKSRECRSPLARSFFLEPRAFPQPARQKHPPHKELRQLMSKRSDALGTASRLSSIDPCGKVRIGKQLSLSSPVKRHSRKARANHCRACAFREGHKERARIPIRATLQEGDIFILPKAQTLSTQLPRTVAVAPPLQGGHLDWRPLRVVIPSAARNLSSIFCQRPLLTHHFVSSRSRADD